jgi:hypothetical protein
VFGPITALRTTTHTHFAAMVSRTRPWLKKLRNLSRQ